MTDEQRRTLGILNGISRTMEPLNAHDSERFVALAMSVLLLRLLEDRRSDDEITEVFERTTEKAITMASLDFQAAIRATRELNLEGPTNAV